MINDPRTGTASDIHSNTRSGNDLGKTDAYNQDVGPYNTNRMSDEDAE